MQSDPDPIIPPPEVTIPVHDGAVSPAQTGGGPSFLSCTKCELSKPDYEFPKNIRSKTGRGSRCKSCLRELYNSRSPEQREKEKLREAARRGIPEVRERIAGYKRAYQNRLTREKRELNNSNARERRKLPEVKLKNKIYWEEYKKKNAVKISERRKKYNENTKGKRKEYFRAYSREKSKNSVQFRLARNLRGGLHSALHHGYKSGSAVSDLGCSIAELKQKIERQFLPGMSWENYGNKSGQWSVDHIIPMYALDLTIRNNLLVVCNYSNLRPLWCLDNIERNSQSVKEYERAHGYGSYHKDKYNLKTNTKEL